MGQSIGLHVESSPSYNSKASWTSNRAHWRRTWYSMYVLDRLLALQLGRPMAIHEADFHVELPSVEDSFPFDPATDEVSPMGNACSHVSLMHYFLEVIRFSHIVGLVIQELYRPSQIDLSPDQMLNAASVLDQRLTKWKNTLPHHLRLDLGHTFEKSIFFKRQVCCLLPHTSFVREFHVAELSKRNMLAVKFHHLRALTHRPFLCLPLLQMNNPSFMNLLHQDKYRISQAEWNCIYEARQTAHLLHNVVDECGLVHDFPWWQMISCLICASSILFVAETFYRHNNLLHGKTSAQDLRDDAETCLKVFEALSMNSAAAQKAAEILGGLSRMRRPAEEAMSRNVISPSQSTLLPTTNPQDSSQTAADTLGSTSFASSPRVSAEWPSEISSAMEWSLRFLDFSNIPPVDLPFTGDGQTEQ